MFWMFFLSSLFQGTFESWQRSFFFFFPFFNSVLGGGRITSGQVLKNHLSPIRRARSARSRGGEGEKQRQRGDFCQEHVCQELVRIKTRSAPWCALHQWVRRDLLLSLPRRPGRGARADPFASCLASSSHCLLAAAAAAPPGPSTCVSPAQTHRRAGAARPL